MFVSYSLGLDIAAAPLSAFFRFDTWDKLSRSPSAKVSFSLSASSPIVKPVL